MSRVVASALGIEPNVAGAAALLELGVLAGLLAGGVGLADDHPLLLGAQGDHPVLVHLELLGEGAQDVLGGVLAGQLLEVHDGVVGVVDVHHVAAAVGAVAHAAGALLDEQAAGAGALVRDGDGGAEAGHAGAHDDDIVLAVPRLVGRGGAADRAHRGGGGDGGGATDKGAPRGHVLAVLHCPVLSSGLWNREGGSPPP